MTFPIGRTILLALLMGSSVVAWADGSVERGRSKAVMCVACHGAQGETTNPEFPQLAGQNAGYLAIQLQEFKSGKRYHPVMSPVARDLTEQDIADLAAYYSQLGENEESEGDQS
ncbi:c-type cytochrome [Marinobacter salicampi]|uniref:c-type cytochrome n=1 Tax=Marinobacter salicampi TaxID=435907 RepID=UPI001407C025|nr:cytochrome c [Marinobacter salicampi]